MKFGKKKMVAYFGMIALLASLIIGVLGFSNSTKSIDDIKNQLLKKHVENNIKLTMKYITSSYGSLSQGNGTLLDSKGKSIEGKFGVVDTVLEDLGDKSSIFVKINDDFKRISTNIMYDGKERATGTFLGSEHKAYKTVMNGEMYVGEAEILGEHYFTAYQPLKDNNNNVIGLLFVGTPTKILDEIISVYDTKMHNINVSIIALRAVSLGSLIALITVSLMGKNKKED